MLENQVDNFSSVAVEDVISQTPLQFILTPHPSIARHFDHRRKHNRDGRVPVRPVQQAKRPYSLVH